METPQQYSARILSYSEGKNSLKILSETPQKIQKLIKGKSKAMLHRKPLPAKWSAAEIISHLAETELVMGWRYRSIAGKNEVPLQAYEQDDWAVNSHYDTLDVKEMMEMFSVLRRANLTFLKNLPLEKWNNFGMHQERGKETIRHIINLEAGHDINHLSQIRAILQRPLRKK
ncbi:MAG: DinB family protein [Bacteroidota bacterium]|nr:DinB family protein [Bacteroidota bacterium]